MFKYAFNSFEVIFKEFKKKANLFFSEIEPFINAQKNLFDEKEKNHIKNLLDQTIEANAIYSPYYEGLKYFLFRIDDNKPNEAFDLINPEILAENTIIKDIEYKYQGAILVIMDSIMGKDKLSILLSFSNKENEENRKIIKGMISLLTGKNYRLYEKNYLLNKKNNYFIISLILFL